MTPLPGVTAVITFTFADKISAVRCACPVAVNSVATGTLRAAAVTASPGALTGSPATIAVHGLVLHARVALALSSNEIRSGGTLAPSPALIHKVGATGVSRAPLAASAGVIGPLNKPCGRRSGACKRDADDSRLHAVREKDLFRSTGKDQLIPGMDRRVLTERP